MKKFLGSILLMLPYIAFAQGLFIKNPLASPDAPTLVKNVAVIIRAVAIPFAAVAIIVVGFKIVASIASGQSEELSKAKKALVWVLTGSAIIVGSTVIAEVVVNFASKL